MLRFCRRPCHEALDDEDDDDFLDEAGFDEGPELMAFSKGLSSVGDSAGAASQDVGSSEPFASSFAKQVIESNAAKGSVSLPVTVIEELIREHGPAEPTAPAPRSRKLKARGPGRPRRPRRPRTRSRPRSRTANGRPMRKRPQILGARPSCDLSM